MFQDLCQCGKKVLWAIIVPSAFMSLFVPVKAASSFACILALTVAFSVMCFPVKTSHENQKTVAIAAFVIVALVFYTLAAILWGLPLMTIMIFATFTWLTVYLMARFLQTIDPQCPFVWYFVVLLPLGFVIVRAAAILSNLVSPNKKVG